MKSVRSSSSPVVCLVIFALILLCSALAMVRTSEAGTRYSANIVGFSRVTVPPSNTATLAGMSFKPFDATLKGVIGTNQLRAAGNYSNADVVLFWDPISAQYMQYALKTNDYEFHNCLNLTEWNGPATNPVLTNGMGFFIRSPSDAVCARSVVIMGQAVDSPTQYIGMVSGKLQLVCYPYSSSIGIQQTDFANDGAKRAAGSPNADQILIFTNYSVYVNYFLKTNGLWYCADVTMALATNTFRVGQGFWYRSKKAFTWSETNCYQGSL